MKILRLHVHEGKMDYNQLTYYELQATSEHQHLVLRKSVGFSTPTKVISKETAYERADRKREAQYLLLQWYYTHVIYAEQLKKIKRWIFWHWMKTAWIDDGWIVKNWFGKHYIHYLGT